MTVDLRREDTKSESPELGDSMFTDMPMVLVDPPLEQIQIDVPASNPSSDVPMPPSRIDHESSVNASAESSVYENDALPRGNVTGSNVSSSSSKQTHSSSDILFAETRQRFNDLRQSSNAIIEPIESDGDTCGQQQSMQSGKIRKLDLGTSTDDSSPRTSSSLVHVSLKGCSTGAVSHNIFDRHDAHSEVPASNHEEKSLALGSTTPSQSETRSSYGQKVNPIDDAAVGQEHSEHFNVSDGVRRADEDIEKNRTREQEVHPKSRSAVQIKVAMPEPEPKSCPTKVTTRQPANREKDQAEKLAGNERSRIAKSQDDHATQAKQEEHKRSCEMQMARDAEKKAKEARETAFRKQAEKAMQAADGAKELKAVKLQRARATPAPTGPRTPISYAKSGQEKDRLSDETRKRKADEVGDKEEAKTREGVIAQENIQGSLDSDPDRIGNTVARNEHQEEAMITDKSKVTKHLLCELRELSASRSLHSSSPIESNSITGQRRSTTPVIPRSLAAKTSTTTQGNLLSSSPLTSKSARDDDTPLRSALKKSNISPRRSVSFVDSTTPTLPAHPSIDRLDRQRSWPAKPLLPLDRQLGDTGNRNPDCVERKALSHVSATPHARAKIQTRLNVIRDKRKGRVVDPPVQTATVENRASMSSSQDENIWYVPLDEVLGGNGSAMAGPSSITPLRRSISSTMNHSAPTPSKIDPDVQTTTKEPVLPTTPAPTLQSLSQPILSSDDKSSARSPPQIVPETYLVSSDSSSEESDLSPEPIASKEVSDPPRASQGSNYSTSDNGATSLQSSTAGPRTSHVNQLKRKATDSLSEDTKRLNSHYSRSSAQPSASRKFPPLDRHGRLPNGTRPAYYKFPKLSKYISDAKSEDLQLQQKPDVPIKVDSAPETSSSSDEDSDSFSDGSDVDPAKIASKAKSRSAFPGLSGLVRSKFLYMQHSISKADIWALHSRQAYACYHIVVINPFRDVGYHCAICALTSCILRFFSDVSKIPNVSISCPIGGIHR